jgi:eukaryotic-like serine/threonine-protein kinase
VKSLSSCTRCSRPAAVLSPGGLCAECAVTGVTPDTTSRAQTPQPLTARDLDPAAPTLSAAPDPAAATATLSNTTPRTRTLPHAPPGYELLDELGEGGMGAVYLARDLAADRLIAMKFIHLPGNQIALDRFLRELRILTRLDHPHIVRVLANDFLRANPFFTMEYMPGGSLSKVTSPAKPLRTSEAVRLIRLVADAVTAAHAQGVIHRDLKPSNILLTADGTPKVADFGLAKRLDQDDGVTIGSAALGTPSYMPPEQISSKNGELGPWSDVYGLGATLYQLLTGRAPFVGPTAEDILPQVLADPPTRPRALQPGIPAALEGIVVKCLEKDPKDRYQSVAELAADLDRFTAGQKPAAPPLTPWRRARRWAARNRRDVTVAGMVMLVLVGVFALASAFWSSGSKTEEETVAEIRRELAAGRPVVLVDEKGRARYKKWVIGTGEFVDPDAGTASCWARYDALLELGPNPQIDRYWVSGEIRQLESTARVEGGGGFTVGFYFGHDVQVGEDGTKVHTFSALRFSDFHPNPARRTPPGIEYDDNLLVYPPLKSSSGINRGVSGVPTDAVSGLPGPWRRFEFELTPDWIEVVYGQELAKRPPPVRHDLAGINARIAKLQNDLDTPPLNRFAGGAKLAAWSPRRPFGIYVHGATAEVKNVVITPQPVRN